MLTLFNKKLFKKNSGFSLIELLVATSIIITATTVVLTIIMTSFRSSNKINSNQIIRENGNHVINQMSRMIQFADSFGGASSTGDVSSYGPCPSEGVNFSYIKLKYQKEDKILSCTNTGIKINDESIINVSKVAVVEESCSFICSQEPGSGPVININFQLTLINTGDSPEKSAAGEFSTSAKMRNF